MGQALTKAEILTPISTGTPRRWDTPEQLIGEANKYLVDCRAEDRPFTLVGLRCEIGCSHTTWAKYARGDYGQEFKAVCSQIKQHAERDLFEGGLLGKYQPTIVVNGLKYNHGYTEDRGQLEEAGKEEIPPHIVVTFCGDIKTESITEDEALTIRIHSLSELGLVDLPEEMDRTVKATYQSIIDNATDPEEIRRKEAEEIEEALHKLSMEVKE